MIVRAGEVHVKEFKLALKMQVTQQWQFTPGLPRTTNVISMSETILFGDGGWGCGDGRAEGEVVVKGIRGGVWNSYSTSPIWLTLLENDRNKLFPILASHSPLLSFPFFLLSPPYVPHLFSTLLTRSDLIGRVISTEAGDSLFLHSLFPGPFYLSSSVHLFHKVCFCHSIILTVHPPSHPPYPL